MRKTPNPHKLKKPIYKFVCQNQFPLKINDAEAQKVIILMTKVALTTKKTNNCMHKSIFEQKP